MIHEIGSFFPISLNINYKNILNNFIDFYRHFFFISGRAGIKYIVNNLSVKKYLLPNYLCKSIIQNFNNENYDFYKIDNNLKIDYNFLKEKIKGHLYESIFIINYFGIIDDNIDKIIELCKNNNILIIQDSTHNLYDEYHYGDIILSSFRKCLPTPFGCIIIDNTNKLPKQSNTISFKMLTINLIKIFGMTLKKMNFFKKIWYNLLSYCENNINTIYETNFDYINFVFFILYYKLDNIFIRQHNYNLLKDLCKYNSFTDKQNIYFTYPILFKSFDEREKIRTKLIKNNIYPVVYWPLNFDKKNYCNIYICERILAIPIDERYNTNDMKKICDIINE